MRVPIQSWTIYDWQGPTTGVRLRITADDTFLARENDGSGVEVGAHPKVFREVDCTVGTAIIDGLMVKSITIPALWLYSTNDALVGKTNARYTAKFVTKGGADIKPLETFQSFQLPVELTLVFNPVPWHEIARFNNPAAPVPMNMETFSTEQILELIGGGSIVKGTSAIKQMAYWSGPITLSGSPGVEFQEADESLTIVPQNATWNPFRIKENAGLANIKVGANPALASTHVVNETGLWHRALINDAATRRWTENVKDGASGLQYSAYDSGNVLQGSAILDPAGGVGVADSGVGFGYLYKASSAYHLGINAAGAGIASATKELTFVAGGVGINKPTAIGAQFHVLSGDAGRIGVLVDTAGSPTQPIMQLRNGTNVRFSFNHDGVATFGLASSVKGRLSFAAATNSNIHSLEAPDTPAANVQYKLPAASPANGQVLRTLTFSGGIATLEWVNPTAGGDVSSDIGTVIDNKLARFNGTTGKIITDSAVVVADTTGIFTVPDTWGAVNAAGLSFSLSAAEFMISAPATTGFSNALNIAALHNQSNQTGRMLRLAPTYNQTGTSASDDIFINRTETAIGSGTHNFIRAQVASVTKFRIDRLGNFLIGANAQYLGEDTGGQILALFGQGGTSSNSNYLALQNGLTGQAPAFSALGVDSNIPILLSAKGSEYVIASPFFKIQDTATPHVRFIRSNATARTVDFGIDSADNFGLFVQGVNNPIVIAMATGVATFAAIPVLPNVTPTTDNQAARKKYVDDRKVSFSASFMIVDPSTATLSSLEFGEIIIPGGGTYTVTKAKIAYVGGSHTSGGSSTYIIQQQGVGTRATLVLNDTNNTVNTVFVDDVGDFTVSENALLGAFISARSGTVSERNVSIAIEGYRTAFN